MKDVKEKTVTAFVLGIVSVLAGLLGFLVVTPAFGLASGIVGLILAKKINRYWPTELNTAGIVLSIVGIVLSGLGLLFWIAVVFYKIVT